MIIAEADYGPFASLVAIVTSVLAAAGAIIFGFKRSFSWEPAEEDIPNGAKRVVTMIVAIGIGLLYFKRAAIPDAHLIAAAILCVVITVAALIGYGILIGIFTYEKERAISPTETEKIKVIGGLRLTEDARQERSARRPRPTVQALFRGAAFDKDVVWERWSVALARSLFVISYLLLVSGGALALAVVGVIFSDRGPDVSAYDKEIRLRVDTISQQVGNVEKAVATFKSTVQADPVAYGEALKKLQAQFAASHAIAGYCYTGTIVLPPHYTAEVDVSRFNPQYRTVDIVILATQRWTAVNPSTPVNEAAKTLLANTQKLVQIMNVANSPIKWGAGRGASPPENAQAASQTADRISTDARHQVKLIQANELLKPILKP